MRDAPGQPAFPPRRIPALLCSIALAGCAGARVDSTPPEVSAPDDPVLCSAAGPANPSWHHRAVGYEVFVRSFQDSDGDGIGDLKGLAQRLDYLNDGDDATADDLGIDLLWLMPIAASPSYHGYDVTDYDRVNPAYGTDADLQDFLVRAHARGIRVITDLVLNHSSDAHPWFADARRSRASAHRDWYVWSDSFLAWQRPWGGGPVWIPFGDAWYYALFWGGMPDLNWQNPSLRARMLDTARGWLGRGLDGFRLDAARYLVEDGPGAGQADTAGTHEVLRDLRAATDAARPGSLLVGEIWEKPEVVAPYLSGKDGPELQAAFDFDLAQAVKDGILNGDGAGVRAALCSRLQAFPPEAATGVFLSNHDQARVATVLQDRGDAALRLAATVLMTVPGTPWIYYGEEIGMRNGPTPDDMDKRRPMQWDDGPNAGFTGAGEAWWPPQAASRPSTVAGQSDDPDSLLSWYRRLVQMRRAHPALSSGSTALLDPAGMPPGTVVLRRQGGGETLWVAWSFADSPVPLTLPAAFLGSTTRFTDLLAGTSHSRSAVSSPLSLGVLSARGAAVLAPQEPR